MAETELEKDVLPLSAAATPIAVPGDGADDGVTTPRREISASEALALLQAGKPLVDVKVKSLRLKGLTFAHPLAFRNVAFQRLEVSRCAFQGEVAFTSCVLQRPMIGDSTFEGA